jgi:hypothetical protein
MRALNLEWLPRLAEESFIEVRDEDLGAVEREARLIIERLRDLVGDDEMHEYVKTRLTFLLEACAMARGLGASGMVCIG